MTEQTEPGEFRERHYRSQDGLRLYFRDYGDPLSPRHPVLCLSGLTRNAADFHDFATRLARTRRVICPDYRGRGRSAYDQNWRNYEPKTYINDIAHLLALCNIHSVVVVGASLGGLLAMGLAVARPTTLAGIVLNDVGPDIQGDGLVRILNYIGHDAPQPDWDTAVAHLKVLFPHAPPDTPAKWLRFARATFREGEDGLLHFNWDPALARPLRRSHRARPDLWPLFGALRPFPVLALRGELSDVLAPDTFERMGREHPDLIRITVPKVGHVPLLDEPPACEAIDGFLDSL
ncbi:alpha/beta fold hydrolase [Rhodospirillaceae bacterium SYSU D60014]|uniref:alpha/beta fold hydrolase n=1 Tax=Virgifigura deserti TaxID=2268457 RepID=UPI0013C4AB30